MTELKRIRVRKAKIRDIGLFKKLWIKLLDKQSLEGSIVLSNEKTMDFYEKLFNAYVEGILEGIVLFVADKGVLMWGDSASLRDYPGKFIVDWGVYINSDVGEEVYSALWDHAFEWSKEHKFEGILIEQYKDSEEIKGFETVSKTVYKKLE